MVGTECELYFSYLTTWFGLFITLSYISCRKYLTLHMVVFLTPTGFYVIYASIIVIIKRKREYSGIIINRRKLNK